MRKQKMHRLLALILVAGVLFGCDWGVRQIYLLAWKKPFLDLHPHRVQNEHYHHGILPNQASEDIYGPYRAPYFSNSLGFRDAQIREVPLAGDRRRILFIS